MSKIGILLTNTGTPDEPTPAAIRRYLREFLSDPHVVKLPRILWLPVLYGLILPFRPYKSVKLYQKIWTSNGSPIRFLTQSLRNKLNTQIQMPVEIGMNYGNPSISEALKKLQQNGVKEIKVLPLYPQYSHTTTGSSFSRVAHNLGKYHSPKISLIHDYANHPSYIQALTLSLSSIWLEQGESQHLLISFHGIPERFVKSGDPYQSQCEMTARLLAEKLNLPKEKWTLCYQSQFGYDKWLKPGTFDLLALLPKQGIKKIDIICPGFAVDCLETLEEIAIRGREVFLEAGGESLRYIPALNDSDLQVNLLLDLLKLRD